MTHYGTEEKNGRIKSTSFSLVLGPHIPLAQ